MSTASFELLRRPLTLDFLALSVLGLTGLVAAHSTLAATNPGLMGPAILFDATATAGMLHAWLGVRKGGLPAWTIIPVAGLGLLVCTTLPSSLSPTGTGAVVALALLEASAVGLAVFRFTALIRGYRGARREGGSRLDALEAGLVDVAPFMPSLGRHVRTEVELWWFSVAGWFQRAPQVENAFWHHREVGWTALASTLAALSMVEGAVVHWLLVSHMHTTAALVVSGLHIYGLAWVFGDMHALRLRPSSISGDGLRIRLGLRGRVHVGLGELESIEVGEWVQEEVPPDAVSLSVLGAPNLRITTSRPVRVERFLRAPRDVCEVYVQVDNPGLLREAVLSAQL